MIEIRKATIHDANKIAKRLRRADLEEIRASHGAQPSYGPLLAACVCDSKKAWAAYEGDTIIALGGVAEVEGPPDMTVGVPWMVATPYAPPRFFLREARAYISELLDDFDVLTNYVDARNEKSIQWLHRMGFEFCDVAPFYGAEKRPFIQFYQSKP